MSGSGDRRISLWGLLLASAFGVGLGTAVYVYATSRLPGPGETATHLQLPVLTIAAVISPTNVKVGDTIDITITVEKHLRNAAANDGCRAGVRVRSGPDLLDAAIRPRRW